MDAALIIFVVAALAIGGLIGWLLGARQSAGDRQSAQMLRLQLDEVILERDANNGAAHDLASLRAKQEERDLGHEKQLTELRAFENKIESRFGELAGKAVETAHETFLKRADEKLDAKGRENVAKLENILRPVATTLETYQKELKSVETTRTDAYSQLRQQLTSLRDDQLLGRKETARLTNALRSNSQTRGRWGELQLKNLLEMSGLSAHVDFTEQTHVEGEDSSLRPDAIIRLPGNKSIVIDVKCAFNDFEESCAQEDESDRERCLQAHARAMRNHAVSLTRKAYWTQFKDSPDFVIMFIPGEHFLAAALERDRELLQWAFERNVVIASTINLLGLARTMAWIWRQTALADDTKKVEELGKALHDRLSVAAGHLRKVGGGLASAVSNYNSFVGSFDTSVLREGRKFKELSVDSSKEIDEVPLVEVIVRETSLLPPSNDDPPQIEAAE